MQRHGAHIIPVQRPFGGKRQIGEPPLAHAAIFVAGQHHVAGFVDSERGDGRRCDAFAFEPAITLPNREPAVVAGREQGAVALQKRKPVHRFAVRPPAANRRAVRQSPEADEAVRAARGQTSAASANAST